MFAPLHISEVKTGIGNLVKTMRTRRKLTQEELGKQLNLSRITIQNIERGNNFTIDTFLLICQHFNELDSFHAFIQSKLEDFKPIKSYYDYGTK
jgi:DNA-binding XRE family transcriptional regulator